MTVRELYDRLGKMLADHAERRVIIYAHSNYKPKKDDWEDIYFLELTDVYYQSGDIEIECFPSDDAREKWENYE